MKKIGYFVAIVVLIVVINGLAHSIYDLWHKKGIVKEAQVKLDSEKKENARLKTQLKEVQSEAFLESEARNKLFLVKPGEQEVLMSRRTEEKKVAGVKTSLPIWQQWVRLFL